MTKSFKLFLIISAIDLLDLHTHMLEHVEGGNYFYQHATRTAFPKHDYVCCETQTDLLANDLGTRDRTDENTGSNDVAFVKSEYRPEMDSTGDNSQLYLKQELIVKTEPDFSDDDSSQQDDLLDTDEKQAAKTTGGQSKSSLIVKGKRKRSVPSRLILEHQQSTQVSEPGVKDEVDELDEETELEEVDDDDGEEEQQEKPKKRKRKGKKSKPKVKGHKDATSEQLKLRRIWKIDKTNLVHEKESMDIVFYCPHCPQSYMRRNRLFHHVETDHAGEYTKYCEKCMIPFIYDSDFEKHVKVCKATEAKTHVCPLCEKPRLFLTRPRIEQHLQKDHFNQQPFKCEKCGEKIVSEFDRKVHMATHDVSLLKCKVCGNGHKSIYRLECHMTEHNREFPFTCYICEKQLNSEYAVWEHVEAHIESMMRYCETCGMNYCKTHNCQVGVNDGVDCKVCGKHLACKKSLERHMDVHEQNYRFHCDQCGEKFIYQKYFVVHLARVHGQGTSYKCSKCDKVFYLRCTLTRHEKTHDKIRPHVCQFCGFSFSTTWNLKAHIRQHTGEKPYQCSKCGQTFTHNVVRKSHETNCMLSQTKSTESKSKAKQVKSNETNTIMNQIKPQETNHTDHMANQMKPHDLNAMEIQRRQHELSPMGTQMKPHDSNPMDIRQHQTSPMANQMKPHDSHVIENHTRPQSLDNRMENQLKPYDATRMENQMKPYDANRMENQMRPHEPIPMDNQIRPNDSNMMPHQMKPHDTNFMVNQMANQIANQTMNYYNPVTMPHPQGPTYLDLSDRR